MRSASHIEPKQYGGVFVGLYSPMMSLSWLDPFQPMMNEERSKLVANRLGLPHTTELDCGNSLSCRIAGECVKVWAQVMAGFVDTECSFAFV